MDVPSLSTAQMIEVDRAMMEDFRIELMQMMENAGRNLAALARSRFLNGDPRGQHVVVLAGTGGNGGGAMVAARRLHNWGASVQVALTRPQDVYKGVPGHQLDVLQRMQVPLLRADQLGQLAAPAVILDGIIGYSLSGAPQGGPAALIRWANQQTAPTLSLDTPSGLDTTTGTIYEPAIRAAATMTLALPKEGLHSEAARPLVGELYLADISVPPALYAAPALQLAVGPLFAKDDIIRLW